MWTNYLYLFSVLAALSLTFYAAYSDFKSLTIPNWISLTICLLYPIAVFTSPVEIDWIWALAVFGSVFVCGFLLYVMGGLGGGDVKLISVLCLWAGFGGVFPFLFTTVVAGGILVPVIIVREALKMPDDTGSFTRRIRSALRARLQIPYGVAISLGSILIFYEYASYANLSG